MPEEHSNGPLPTISGAALRLHLSFLRSSHLTARALAETFPDEQSWIAFLGSDAAADSFERFADHVNTIRGALDAGAVVDFKQLEELGSAHLDAGIEAVADVAATVGVDPQDLLVTLLYG